MPDLPKFPFDFGFCNKTDLPDAELYEMAYDKITNAAEDHNDIVGASVTLEELSSQETPHAYRARVSLYVQPFHISSKEEMASAQEALQNALKDAIREVRKKRN
jgi:hypothetical protein